MAEEAQPPFTAGGDGVGTRNRAAGGQGGAHLGVGHWWKQLCVDHEEL